ncbi:hypothetical protein GW17_00016062 [Ensete ventricosum]|nr:hypothetical protein GW17_00016062 [Ensete ventricosum]RZS16629.1 hypothetical protein BHM03_00048653 [Ensete ventricosum]
MHVRIPSDGIKVGHGGPIYRATQPKPRRPLPIPQLPKPFLRSIFLPGMAAEPENAAGNETFAEADTKAEVPSSPAAEAEIEENDAAAEEDDDVEEEEEDEDEEEEVAKDESPPAEAAPTAQGGGAEVRKWPGWPGDNVFRLVVPVLKVGSIIGRKGELIKKLCEETKARVRILEGPIGVNDRIVSLSPLVLISGKEEPEAEISPAMDAMLRIFKRVNGISDSNSNSVSASGTCSVRLLVAASQAVNLIGKKGEAIRSIQESSNATVRVLSGMSRIDSVLLNFLGSNVRLLGLVL